MLLQSSDIKYITTERRPKECRKKHLIDCENSSSFWWVQ